MSDDADRAQPNIENTLADALAAARSRPAMHSNGQCFFCEEEVSAGVLFCNTDCRDDYQRLMAARRRNGDR